MKTDTGFTQVPRRLSALAYYICHLDIPAFFSDGPVLIFNHIPKCGGSSLRLVLRHWYWVVKDYWDGGKTPRIDLSRLRQCHCLSGHYLGKQLMHKYPAIAEKPEQYRLISFVRNPLEQKISHYFHRRAGGRILKVSLNDFLLSNPNFQARILGCTYGDYKDVLDAYFFVGCLEDYARSVQVLAKRLNKTAVKIHRVNRSTYPPDSALELDEKVKKKFYEANLLDYLIYDYCRAKVKLQYKRLIQ